MPDAEDAHAQNSDDQRSGDLGEKSIIRKTALAKRQARPQDPRDAHLFVQKFHADLQSHLILERNTVVGGYWPIQGEADPGMLLEYLRGMGCLIVLPRHDPETGEMEFPIWVAGSPLVEGDNGIYMPPPNMRALSPEVLLVPLLAFDDRGYRIGYGAGFYDRALSHWSNAGKSVVSVGLAFQDQKIDHIPAEEHDQRLQWILTERAVYKAGL